MFGDIHIDVKKAEDLESDLIFSEKLVESGQKWRFFKVYRNVGKWTYLEKTPFFHCFRPTF